MSRGTKGKSGLTEKLEMAAVCCWRGQLRVAGYEGEIDGETGDGSHVLQGTLTEKPERAAVSCQV